jgi:hypothetical protein
MTRVSVLHTPYFCMLCSADALKPIRLRLCCPICTADVDLYLCPRCAEELIQGLAQALREMHGEEAAQDEP